MSQLRNATLVAIVSATFSPLMAAASQQLPGLTVSVEWLAEHIDDPEMSLIHVGPADGYTKAHLPNARYLALGMFRAPRDPDNSLEMPSAHQLSRDLAALGIGNRSTVVIVHDREWLTAATRAQLTLAFAGFKERVAILDGGQPAWVRAGHPVTDRVPQPSGVTVEVTVDSSVLASLSQVRSATQPGSAVRIVDARAPVFFDGPQSGDRPAGHIPGAVNIPFTSVVNDDLTMKSVLDLRELFETAGIRPGEPLILYCHIGQQATLVLAAAKVLGHPVQLFDGSFEEWSKHDLPIEGGGKR